MEAIAKHNSYAETFATAKGIVFRTEKTPKTRIQELLQANADYKAYSTSLDLNNDGKVDNTDLALAN